MAQVTNEVGSINVILLVLTYWLNQTLQDLLKATKQMLFVVCHVSRETREKDYAIVVSAFLDIEQKIIID